MGKIRKWFCMLATSVFKGWILAGLIWLLIVILAATVYGIRRLYHFFFSD